jgi:putative pyrroloquinoline-quinone binding quinoprotein
MRAMKSMAARVAALSVAAGSICAPLVNAQGRGGPPPWTTAAADAQRTASVNDPRLTPESVAKDVKFLWKRTLDNEPKGLDALTQPVLLPNIISYRGFKALAFVGGSSDAVYAIDYDLSRVFWQRRLQTGTSAESASVGCPGALTTITRATAPRTSTSAAGGRGREGAGQPAARPAGTPAAAAAGVPPAPGAAVVGGAPDPRLAAAGRGAAPIPPPSPANPPMPGSGPGPNAVLGGYAAARGGNANVYAISSGGRLHALNPQDGTDMVPAINFLPPGSKAIGSILMDSVLYAATTGGCGGAPNGVWAIELAQDAYSVTRWETKGDVAGDGPAFGTDGTIYVATGGAESALVALEPKTLKVKGSFGAAKTAFTTSPVVFTDKGRTLIAAGNKDGRVYVLDAADLASGRPLESPLLSSEPLTSRSGTITGLATANDPAGTRWIVASVAGPVRSGGATPSAGGAVALQLGDPGGTPVLRVQWTSRDLISPVTPAIVNGVVFALSSGEDSGSGSAAERAQRSKPAVLYAFDATSGKELWSSASTITSFAHGVGPSIGDSQVYVVTHDSTLYAFGIPLER